MAENCLYYSMPDYKIIPITVGYAAKNVERNGYVYFTQYISASEDLLEYALTREYYLTLRWSLFYTHEKITIASLNLFFATEFNTAERGKFPKCSQPINIKYFTNNTWNTYVPNIEELNKMLIDDIEHSKR